MLPFDAFIHDYKISKTRANKNWKMRVPSWQEKRAIFLLSLLCVSCIVLVVSVIIIDSRIAWLYAYFLCVAVTAMLLLHVMLTEEENKAMLRYHYDTMILPLLKGQLQRHQLNNRSGIKWLIHECENKMKERKKHRFYLYLAFLIFLSFVLGFEIALILNGIRQIPYFIGIPSAVFFGFALSLFFWMVVVFSIVINYRSFRDKHLLDCYAILKADLSYLRTQRVAFNQEIH